MSVLSNFPAMANRIAFTCEYLHFLGNEGGDRKHIENQLSPLRVEDEEGSVGSTIAKNVLFEMEKLKLIEANNGSQYRLAPDIFELAPDDCDWLNALRPTLTERLIFPEHAESYGQKEVPDALAWLLNQSPYEALFKKSGALHVQRIENQLGGEDSLRTEIGNNARFQNLLYWARYLGFAEWIGFKQDTVVVPDPSRAIAWSLPQVFLNSNELSISVFLQHLCEFCPVLDGGSARSAFESRLMNNLQRNERHLSGSTSLALKRLELRGVITMFSISDAQTWILDYGSDQRKVSGIRFNREVSE